MGACHKIWLCLAFLLALAGCASTSSDNVRTKGIYAEFNVTRNADQPDRIVAYARLTTGDWNGTELILENGEYISCNGISMDKKEDILYRWYETIFSQPQPSYTFLFHRIDEADVDTVLGTVPALPELQSLPVAESGQSLNLHWTGSSEPGMTTRITLTCSNLNYSKEIQVPDTGEYLVSPSNLPISDAHGDYILSVTISRIKTFSINPRYGEGGYAFTKSSETRTTLFHLNPCGFGT